MNAPICMALSGGVDSAVSLLLLRERGEDVRAVFMKNWEEDDAPGFCAAEADLADATSVCERLGVALETVNFSHDYWEEVFEKFLEGSRLGITPNPDVLCNQTIKFHRLVEHVRAAGGERVATGHYARIDRSGNRIRLLRGVDSTKDQSYFLCRLGAEQLEPVEFPIGALTKTEVRRHAARAGLPVADKRDSTGLCFVGERPFRDFIARFIPAAPGDIVDERGTVLGTHQGIHLYTIGQRQGLGVGGRPGGGGEPWYVARKEPDTRRLVVVAGHEHPSLRSDVLTAKDASWIGPVPASQRVTARIRYRQRDEPCRLEALGGARWRVRFDRPQWAVTPGQTIAFYDREECLGGATIEQAGARAGAAPLGVSEARFPARTGLA